MSIPTYTASLFYSRQLRQAFSLCVLALIGFTMQGCSVFDRPAVYRGVTPQEADAIVSQLAGNTKPARTELSQYYSEEEKWVSWAGTWNCNHQLIRVVIRNLILKPASNNLVEGTISQEGDCVATTTESVAGRYDDNFFYQYWATDPTTYIIKYEIDKSRGDNKGRLIFRGVYKYKDDVWSYFKAGDNPTYGVSGATIAESGGPADMRESSGYMPQTSDPRLTSTERQQTIKQTETATASETLDQIEARQAERDASDREDAESSRAAAIASLNRLAANFAAESAQRRNADAERLAASRQLARQQPQQQAQMSQQRLQSEPSPPPQRQADTRSAAPNNERHPCVYESRITYSDYNETKARDYIQAQLSKSASMTATSYGAPARMLSSSDITCHKVDMATPMNACAATVKTEVMDFGSCGSSGVSSGVSR